MTDQAARTGSKAGPAFYARSGGRAADWWTLLHPPYTVWHLSYAVLGAAVAPHRDWVALAATVLAFFLAVGIAAHALDELNGRPLGIAISDRVLWVAAILGLAGAAALGVAGVVWGVWALGFFVPVGVVVVLAYNLELFGGRLHTDVGFATWWGGFPVVVGYVAQQPPLEWAHLVAAGAATAAAVGTAYAQRVLSTPARQVRRRTLDVTGSTTDHDGNQTPLDRARLLAPLEGALRALSWAHPLLAVAVLLAS